MNSEVLAAIIVALATIIAAAIALFKKRKNTLITKEQNDCTITGDKNVTIVGTQNTVSVNSEPNEKKSNLSIVNQKVDSTYALIVDGQTRPSSQKDYSTVNIRIINKGSLDAALTNLTISVENYIIKRDPHFEFSMKVTDSSLCVYALNNGWGEANDFTFDLSLKGLDQFIEKNLLSTTVHIIESNQEILLFKLTKQAFNMKKLKEHVQNKSVTNSLNLNYSDFFNSFKENNRDKAIKKPLICKDSFDEIVFDVSAEINFQDGSKETLTSQRVYKSPCDHIVFTPSGFISIDSVIHACMGCPDIVYASVVKETTPKKEYEISRVVPAGGLDDFLILFTSDKSCLFDVILSFTFNEGEKVTSNVIPISIESFTNSHHLNQCIDGCTISVDRFKRKNHIENMKEDDMWLPW